MVSSNDAGGESAALLLSRHKFVGRQSDPRLLVKKDSPADRAILLVFHRLIRRQSRAGSYPAWCSAGQGAVLADSAGRIVGPGGSLADLGPIGPGWIALVRAGLVDPFGPVGGCPGSCHFP